LKITPLCVSCTLLRRSVELENIFSNEENNMRLSILRELLEAIGLYIGPDIEATELATISFRRLKALAPKIVELYDTLVTATLKMSIERAKDIERIVEDKELEDSIETLLMAASAATGFRPIAGISRLLEEPPSQLDLINIKKGRMETARILQLIREAASSASPVYYLFASAHELPYDGLFIRRLVDAGVHVVGVVRRKRFEDYAIAQDLDRAGVGELLEDIVEIDGSAAPSSDEDEHIVARMSSAPFVVVKGGLQALYFHNNPLKAPTVLLFAASCPVLTKVFNVPPGSLNAIVHSPA